VNFRIWNRTEKKYAAFVYDDFPPGDSALSPNDAFYIFDRDGKDSLRYTWYMYFFSAKDTVYKFGQGDTLKLRVSKPFRNGDVYQFTTKVPTVATALRDTVLGLIRVVPNPYVVQSNQESPLTPGVFGRGQRKIDFINIPTGAKISIFTSRGDHIRTLNQDGSTSGTVSWDVKTKENLDVAYGVYFYVVESTAGQKTGKLAVIK